MLLCTSLPYLANLSFLLPFFLPVRGQYNIPARHSSFFILHYPREGNSRPLTCSTCPFSPHPGSAPSTLSPHPETTTDDGQRTTPSAGSPSRLAPHSLTASRQTRPSTSTCLVFFHHLPPALRCSSTELLCLRCLSPSPRRPPIAILPLYPAPLSHGPLWLICDLPAPSP